MPLNSDTLTVTLQQCNQVQVKGAVATANAAGLPVPAGFRTHKQRSRAAVRALSLDCFLTPL